MKSFRVPIAALMGLVLFCALAFAAFRSLSQRAAVLAFTGMWLALLAGVVAARYGRYRTFWTGFSIVGVGYALLAFAPGTAEGIRPYLLTSTILDEIAGRLGLPNRQTWSQYNVIMGMRGVARVVRVPGGPFQVQYYDRIGQSVAAVVHGIGGGVLGVILASLGHRRDGEGPNESPDP